jgi:hypothetical protein
MNHDTLLVIPTEEAACLQPFRERHSRRAGVTLPPHVSLATPAWPMAELAADGYGRIARICASFPAFGYCLKHVARFEDSGVLYLAPEPAEPFLMLSRALCAPGSPPDHGHGSIVFHVSLARAESSGLDSLAEEFVRTCGIHMPIRGMARDVALCERRGDRWFQVERFPLGAAMEIGDLMPGEPES